MTVRGFAVRIVLLVMLVGVAPGVFAQEPYPSRPITLVVPFPPGGIADMTGRPVAAALEKVLKGQVGVVNKPGATGAVGMQFVATSRPDGYTLLHGISSMPVVPEADRLHGRTPTYTVDQFVPLALISSESPVFVVRAESSWKTAQDFIEDARKRPGQVTYGSAGMYSGLHLSMERLGHAAGLKLRHVPFPGGGPALTAVLGGHVEALSSGISAATGQLESGKLRALATWGDKRLPSLPDVPTFRELGYPDAEFHIWTGVFAPRATPDAILAKLQEALRRAVEDPDFKATMDKIKVAVVFKPGEEFQRFFEADAGRLIETVRRIGRTEPK